MDEIRQRFLADLARASSSKDVEDVRIRYLGRKGAITTLMKDTDFSQMTPGQRKEFGQKINELKALAEAEIAKAAEAAKTNAAAAGTAAPVGKLDLTLPGPGTRWVPSIRSPWSRWNWRRSSRGWDLWCSPAMRSRRSITTSMP